VSLAPVILDQHLPQAFLRLLAVSISTWNLIGYFQCPTGVPLTVLQLALSMPLTDNNRSSVFFFFFFFNLLQFLLDSDRPI
jgi:hypothetical protein